MVTWNEDESPLGAEISDLPEGEFVEIVQGVQAGELVVSTGSRELQTAHASLR